MHFRRAERPERRRGRAFHDVQHFERRHSLAVWRQFVNASSPGNPPKSASRIPASTTARSSAGHRPAQFLRRLQNRRRDLALIKRVGPLFRNQSVSPRQIRVPKHLSFGRCFALRQEHALRLGVTLQLLHPRRPVLGDTPRRPESLPPRTRSRIETNPSTAISRTFDASPTIRSPRLAP